MNKKYARNVNRALRYDHEQICAEFTDVSRGIARRGEDTRLLDAMRAAIDPHSVRRLGPITLAEIAGKIGIAMIALEGER